jgi:hypothetical protein
LEALKDNFELKSLNTLAPGYGLNEFLDEEFLMVSVGDVAKFSARLLPALKLKPNFCLGAPLSNKKPPPIPKSAIKGFNCHPNLKNTSISLAWDYPVDNSEWKLILFESGAALFYVELSPWDAFGYERFSNPEIFIISDPNNQALYELYSLIVALDSDVKEVNASKNVTKLSTVIICLSRFFNH